MSAIAVRVTDVYKRIGLVHANEAVNLAIPAGSGHAVVGENGAGKSALMSILYGMYAPDSGTIEVFGAPVQPPVARPRMVETAGVWMQYLCYAALTRNDRESERRKFVRTATHVKNV